MIGISLFLALCRDEFAGPEPIPKDTDFTSTSVIDSDVPVLVQHSQLDLHREETALVRPMACPSPGS